MDDELNERELRAWRSSLEMHALLRSRIEQQLQADSGLSTTDYSVLAVLSEAPEGRLRAFEMAELLAWEKSRLHHQLNRMSSRGLIVRERCGSRGTDVVLTAKGLRALQEALPGHTKEVRRLFIDPLTPEQLDQLSEISSALLAHLHATKAV